MGIEWWNSIQAVKSVNSTLTAVFVGLGVLTAIFGVAAWFTTERLARLQEEEADRMHHRVETAESEVSSQREAGEQLRERLKSTEATLAEERQKLESVAQAQRPRAISQEASNHLLRSLTAIPKGPVRVTAIAVKEAEDFASQIRDLLEKAGWNPGPVNILTMPGLPAGVSLRIANASAVPPHAGGLQRALAEAGIPAQGMPDPHVPHGTVDILVGAKPTH